MTAENELWKKGADKYVIGFFWDGVACEMQYTYFVILAKLTFLFSASKSSFHSSNKNLKIEKWRNYF